MTGIIEQSSPTRLPSRRLPADETNNRLIAPNTSRHLKILRTMRPKPQPCRRNHRNLHKLSPIRYSSSSYDADHLDPYFPFLIAPSSSYTIPYLAICAHPPPV